MTLSEYDYPALCRSADSSSLRGQRRFLWATRVRLIGLTLAAIGGAFSATLWSVDIFGLLSLVAFVEAIAAESVVLLTKPDRVWYEGRAAAESAKTLAWRYAVAGEPFPKSLAPAQVDDIFLGRLGEILQDLDDVDLTPSLTAQHQITDAMRDLRGRALDERKRAYQDDRVEDQRRWYATKAGWNERQGRRWTLIAIVLEFGGIIGAALKAFAGVDVDLLGLLAAAVAAVTAWTQAKQYQTLNRAYFVASQELASIRSEIERYTDEEEWAQFVQEAEEAISREHTLWRASRGGRARPL